MSTAAFIHSTSACHPFRSTLLRGTTSCRTVRPLVPRYSYSYSYSSICSSFVVGHIGLRNDGDKRQCGFLLQRNHSDYTFTVLPPSPSVGTVVSVTSSSSSGPTIREGSLLEIQTSSSGGGGASGVSGSTTAGSSTFLSPLADTSSSSSSKSDNDLKSSIQLQSNRKLVRVVKRDGKRNWYVIDMHGVTTSVTPKQITYIVGHPDEVGELSERPIDSVYEASCEKMGEFVELLETTWEMLVNEPAQQEEQTLSNLSTFIMDDCSPLACLSTYMLLVNERNIYFKLKYINATYFYEVRSEKNVEELQALAALKDRQSERCVENRKLLKKAYETTDSTLFQSILLLTTANNKIEDVQVANESTDKETVTENKMLEILKDIAIDHESINYNNQNVEHSSLSYVNVANSTFSNLSTQQKAFVKDIFSTLGLPLSPLSAFNLLVHFGIFDVHENLNLLKNKSTLPHLMSIEASRAQALQMEISYLLAPIIDRSEYPTDIDSDHRIDMTGVVCVAIDSEDTSEVDDAFSYDFDNHIIHVHIADPSRYFPNALDNAIVQAALAKTSTLYLPTSKLTMFPTDVAIRLLSLDGELSDGSALTFSFKIDEQTGELDDTCTAIHVSKIDPSKLIRLTYGAVNDILETAPLQHSSSSIPTSTSTSQSTIENILYAVNERAHARRDWREMEGGAILINSPMCNVQVSDGDTVSVQRTLTDSAAWTVVSELMITACAVSGAFAERHDLVVPFRSQEPFDYPSDDELQQVEDGPVRASLAFRHATSTIVSLSAAEHASLGLDQYVQVTSPIRRSLDFMAHLQLKAWLRKAQGVQSDIMLKEIGRAQPVSRLIRTIESRTNRYWQLLFLDRLRVSKIDAANNSQSNGSDNDHDDGGAAEGKTLLLNGTYLKQAGPRDLAMMSTSAAESQVGVVHLDDYAFSVPAQVWAGIKLGTKVNVEVRQVKARAGTIMAIARRLSEEEGDEKPIMEALDEVMSQTSSE